MGKKYRIRVNKECCIGCAACVNAAPELFEMDEEYFSQPVQEIIDEEKLEEAKLAADSCPAECIKIEEIEEV